VNYKESRFVFLYTFAINVYRNLVEKSEGKRPQWSPRRRLEECIKMDRKDQDKMARRGSLGSGVGKWRAPVNTVINLLVP